MEKDELGLVEYPEALQDNTWTEALKLRTAEEEEAYRKAYEHYMREMGCPTDDLQSSVENWHYLPDTPDLERKMEEFQTIARFFRPRDVGFGREGTDILLDTLSEEAVQDSCYKLLSKVDKAKPGDRFFGCTTQGPIDTLSIEPYARPKSKTFLSKTWEGESLKAVKSHEAAHNEIATFGQMMVCELKRRESFGLPNPTSEQMREFYKRLRRLEAILDEEEYFERDAKTGNPRMVRQVDILRELKKIQCQFLDALNKLRQE